MRQSGAVDDNTLPLRTAQWEAVGTMEAGLPAHAFWRVAIGRQVQRRRVRPRPVAVEAALLHLAASWTGNFAKQRSAFPWARCQRAAQERISWA